MENHQDDIQPIGALVAKQFTTQFEEADEWILTKEEEDDVIQHELNRHREHLIWKMKGLGMLDVQINQKLSEMDLMADIDREKILKYSNSCKLHQRWQEKKRKEDQQLVIAREKKLMEEWDAKRMISLMRWTAENRFFKKLIINEENKHLITALCFFLSHDPRFETELGYKFNRGIWIRGKVGLGKTFLVKCLEQNELRPILVQSMIEIAEEVRSQGEYRLPIKGEKIVYFDDVGSEEPIVNHYGSKINYFKTFIEETYLHNHTFNGLMVSTNCGFQEIEEKYGMRVRSRIKDMFNIIDVKGEDMRGK